VNENKSRLVLCSPDHPISRSPDILHTPLQHVEAAIPAPPHSLAQFYLDRARESVYFVCIYH